MSARMLMQRHRSALSRLAWFAPALFAFGAACSRPSGRASSKDTLPPFVDTTAGVAPIVDTATAAAPVAQPTSDLCRLIPSDTVSQILRTTIGKSVSASTSHAGGMCTYGNGAEAASDVFVSIEIGRDHSAPAASTSVLAERGQLGANGTATTDIPGVGDYAFGSSDTAGSYSLMMQQDVVTGRVVVRVRGSDAESLRPAAVAVAKHTLAALR